jgi:hypothetical protein
MNLNINPNPLHCINAPGGVNSVVVDHSIGFLAAGHSVNQGDGLQIVHALAQDKNIDVFFCHGLYPIGTGHFAESFTKANNTILQNALQAKLTVCISEFSANILRHKLHIDPLVTRNGIWTKDYPQVTGSPKGAVLFPKIALDANAKADDLLWLKNNTDFNFLSIAKVNGVNSTGRLSRPEFLKVLQASAVYLGTTKENNSMATMEAMISGVPIVGYDTGFNSEWLTSGDGCELVPQGDRLALRDALRKVMSNWQRYSITAREYAGRFDWQPVINELLSAYEKINHTPENKAVSIIIPCHNYARFLPEAIESALAQTIPCEIIVIDDQSTDDSAQIAKRYPVKLIENENNLGVAETRNKAIRQASGEFIICLDADDRLHPTFAEKHLQAFRSRQDAITYAPINLIDQYGNQQKKKMFISQAVPGYQTQGRNQIPSCCMFRKEFFTRAGGYEKQYTPAEDAQLWLKIFQLGGTARQASASPLMDYRAHGNNLSMQGFPDWWLGNRLNYTAPITDRDPNITIVIEGNEGIEQTLWHLENQNNPKWTALLPQNPNGLKQSFPWLNRGTSRRASVLTIKSGQALPVDYLTEYALQTPPWI